MALLLPLAAAGATRSVITAAAYYNCGLTFIEKIVQTIQVLHIQTYYYLITSIDFVMILHIELHALK